MHNAFIERIAKQLFRNSIRWIPWTVLRIGRRTHESCSPLSPEDSNRGLDSDFTLAGSAHLPANDGAERGGMLQG